MFRYDTVSNCVVCGECDDLFYLLLSDVNECNTTNGGCEQICTNTVGSFACNCSIGYLLDGNGFNCTGKLAPVSLILKAFLECCLKCARIEKDALKNLTIE